MKRYKFIFGLIISVILITQYCFAVDFKILDLREKLFSESNQIKQEINPNNQDFVLLSGLFDSCIQVVTQIDAYFYMLGIFEFIRKEDLNKSCFNFLLSWLDLMKRTNDLNLKNLMTATPANEQNTKIHIEKIKSYFLELDKQITKEQNRFNILMRSLKIR
ncbi:MAG: hypothetical protein NC900_04925 [Candidatus Omnitrophica bacterium]|nr:hypothetical protein [Candidatus Omnitrophota bacterium]MCM8800048.1 hypothetical protein [Candidatus Omnitrophota bacterium]